MKTQNTNTNTSSANTNNANTNSANTSGNTSGNTKASASTVALIGDSVLDDFYWLEDPGMDIRAQLETLLGHDDRVYNFAVDESRVSDVLYGMQPRRPYAHARQEIFKGDYPYPTSRDGKVYPLDLIERVNATHVVLSAGGNDGRVHLDKLINGSDAIIEALLEEGFLENYRKLLEKLCKKKGRDSGPSPKVILVFVYKPHNSIFTWYKEQLLGGCWSWLPLEALLNLGGKLDGVYETIRSLMLDLAREYRVPVIDLSKTFDPENLGHYGTTPIEPSNESGMAIARLIKYVMDNHDRCGKSASTSAIYWAPDCGNKIYFAPN